MWILLSGKLLKNVFDWFEIPWKPKSQIILSNNLFFNWLGGWVGRGQSNLSLILETVLKGEWTSWPTTLKIGNEMGILPHYFCSGST